jgi:pimeloyl-ACP methyl ester carboxylesterase
MRTVRAQTATIRRGILVVTRRIAVALAQGELTDPLNAKSIGGIGFRSNAVRARNYVMIEEAQGCIDYEESGSGPAIVLVPGSCSTGAAWRPVIAGWRDQFRTVTTSLLGYGGTEERRTATDTSIEREAEALESVVRRAACGVHLVGHSFGGLVALAVALRGRVPLASLTILEAPAPEALRGKAEHDNYRAFRQMTERYFAEFASGNAEAIATMIDFYGGAGTFASWPPRVRAYAVKTTPTNILDWASAYAFPLPAELLATIKLPVLVLWGGISHPAVQRANALIAKGLKDATAGPIEGAAHFMISTHASEVAEMVARHVQRTEERAGVLVQST